jgi:DNA-binding NtrC family response regulator
MPPGGPLRAIARELLDTLGRVAPADTDRVVSEFGVRAGEFMETSYRLRTGLREAPLQPAEYLGLAVHILASSGADASALPPQGRSLRVINRRCPFEDLGACGPWLCEMACRLFEAIAVRNFGGGAVTVERADGVHGRNCRFLIEITAGRSVEAEPQPRALATSPGSGAAVPTPVGSEGGLGLVAESPAMRRVVQVVTTVAPSPATVLITGETGVGKELVARLLHALSGRRRAPFVAVNCGAIPETLIETALFGHERGAFTGALQQHQGFFERAAAGTLFLDEIDSLSLAAQSRLLRVLQEGEFERVGGRQVLHTPVRVVVATNRALEDAVRTGRFRQDLYYRIHIVTVHIPPLRERPEDIAPLAQHLLARLARKHGRSPLGLGPRAAAQIAAYPWPGNVRELENALERSLLFTPGPLLEDILLTPGDLFGPPPEPVATAETSWKAYRERVLREAEVRYLEAAMRHCQGDVGAVARSMGLTRRAVYLKLQGCGLRAEQYRR